MTAKKEELPPYHELFELPEGVAPKDFPPPPNFAAIKLWVKRYGPNGIEECPRPWLLSEIPDRASFFDIFGGGRYEVEGRTLGGQFYARRTFVLVGDPKPLVPRSSSETAQPQPQAQPGTFDAFGGQAQGAGGMTGAFQMANGNPMALLFLIMMQNSDRAEARAERQAVQSVEMMKTIATMFGGGQRQATDPAVAQVFGSVTELLKQQIAVTHQPPVQAQRSVEEEFKRAQDLLSLARKMNPDEKPERIVDIIKEILPLVPPGLVEGLVKSAGGAGALVDNGIVVGPVG